MKCISICMVILLIICGCDQVTTKELQRVISPDNSLEAFIVLEMSGGAAGSVVYEVYIKEVKNKEFYLVFEAVDLKDYRLTWVDNDSLVLEYSKGRILSHLKELRIINNTIKIMTRPGV